MDDIKVGDRRRWKWDSSPDEHEVTAVADFAVKISPSGRSDRDGRHWRPEYDERTEPVPAAPTFDRGDVVKTDWDDFCVVTGDMTADDVEVCHANGTNDWFPLHTLTPTGHKVPTVDEDLWCVIHDDGSYSSGMSRTETENQMRMWSTIVAVATIRNGQLVTTYIDDDGVEHLVPCLSEPRS